MKKLHICEQCDLVFDKKSQLTEHNKVVHPPTDLYVHKCDACSKTFGKVSHLNAHKRTVHEKVRPYECETCHKRFGQKGTLKVHIRTVHEKVRPFSCEVCAKSFGTLQYRDTHVRVVHHKDRPHVCEVCTKGFGTISALSKHVRSVHHKDRPYPCDKCVKAFAKKIGLVRHLRKDHDEEDADIDKVTVPRTRTNPVRPDPLAPLNRTRPEEDRCPDDSTSPLPFFPDLEQHPIYTDGVQVAGGSPVQLPPMSPESGGEGLTGRAAPASAMEPSPKRRRTSVSVPHVTAALIERAKHNKRQAGGASMLSIAELDGSIVPVATSPTRRARRGEGSSATVKNEGESAMYADVKPAKKERMTLHRAHLEITLLEQEIDKQIELFAPVTKQKRNGKLVSTRLTQTTFSMRASGGWQSIRNLMARKRRIRGAILLANATTKVSVCGEEYTIAEAIEQKTVMAKEREIVAETRKKVEKERQSVNDFQEQNKWRIAKLVEAAHGARGKDDPLPKEEYDAVAEPYLRENDVGMFDPLRCECLVAELEKNVDAFLATVDECISAANLTGMIEL